MPILGKTDLDISKVGLGTVEIGLPYDIADKRIPTDKEAEYILKSAVDLGITYIDTARGYGLAEERIGKFGISQLPGVIIGTKCAQFLDKGEDPRGAELKKSIRADIEESLRQLQLDTLPLVQFHGGSVEQFKRGELIDIAKRLQQEGKVQYWGAAVRGEDAALAAIATGFFSTIQVAYSILDQRMRPQVLSQAKANNVGVINRSVLLKGALTPKRPTLPAALEPLKTAADQAEAIAQTLNLALPELAIRFAAVNPAVSTILIGTTNPEHLKSALTNVKAEPLTAETLAALYSLAIADPNQIDPSRWPK